MKTHKYFLPLLVLLSLSSQAQTVSNYKPVVNDRLFDNTFISAGAGLQGTFSPGLGLGFNGKGSFVYDVNAGKWFSPAFGARIGFQGLDFNDWERELILLPGANAELGEYEGEPMYNVRTEYSYLHTDILWNISNTLGGYRADRLVSVIPYAHIGYKWLYNSYSDPRTSLKSDFAGGVGAILSFRVHNNLSIYADLRSAYGVRHTIDNMNDDEQMGITFYGIAGATYDINYSNWTKIGLNNQRGYLLNGAFDNTFIGITGGLSLFNVTKDTYKFNAKPDWTAGINFGKWFTPSIGARIGYEHSMLSYFSNEEKVPTWHNIIVKPATFRGKDCNSYTFGLNNIHGDFLWNVSNTFGGYDPDRVYSFIPYASFGFGLSYAKEKGINFRRDFLMGAGILNSFRVWDNISVNADLRSYRMSERKYANTNPKASWISSLALGATYDFGNKPWTVVNKGERLVPVYPDKKASDGPMATGRFFQNSFVSLYSGVNIAFDDETHAAAPGMEIAFGDWVSPYFGFRVGLAAMNENLTAETEKHVYPHVDVMPNLINIISGSSKSRTVDAIPYLGMGYIAKELGWDAGLLTTVQVGDFGQVSLDLRATGADSRMFATGMLGLSYFFGQPDWLKFHPTVNLGQNDRAENVRKVTGFILNKGIFDNTFLTFSAGASTLDFDGSSNAVDISVGKWFSPSLGLRIGYQGRKLARNSGDVYTKLGSNYEHIDVLWNPLNSFAEPKEGRVFDPVLYLQQGIVNFHTPAGSKLGNEYTIGYGLEGVFHVADRLAIVADFKSSFVKDNYTVAETDEYSSYSSALAGIQYTFGRPTWQAGTGYMETELNGTEKPRYWALSTNLLGYADLLTLNLEFQYAVGRHWSLSMQGKLNGLTAKKDTEDQIADRKSVASIGAKYWPWYVYSGWWVKSFAQTENFTRSNLTKNMGFQAGDAYGAGVSAGYALILSKWFNLDFGVGAWGGYRVTKEYEFPDLENSISRTGKAFIDLAEISVSAMFVF